jgi:uncharacterized protein
MIAEKYKEIEVYMKSQMSDSAHDIEHVYRVLNYAYDIARCESGVDYDLLTTAALLHDIGRAEQFANSRIDHAVTGGVKAQTWLMTNGYKAKFAENVRAAITAHRFRSNQPPQSIEAKILFDADKVDVCGAMGLARGLFYKGYVGEPLYTLNADGTVCDGSGSAPVSFFQEYKFKLERIYDRFYTKRGAELGEKRRKAAVNFYNALVAEVNECYGGIDIREMS